MKDSSRERTMPIVAEGGHTTETEILEHLEASPVSCVLKTVATFLFMLHIALFSGGHTYLAAVAIASSVGLLAFSGQQAREKTEHLRAVHTSMARAQIAQYSYRELEDLTRELRESLRELLPRVARVECPHMTAAEVMRYIDQLKGYQTMLQQIGARYTGDSEIITLPEYERKFLQYLKTDIEVCIAFAEKIEEELQE